MAEPFLSEIRMMSFFYAPKGWALCNGQLLPIAQNQALFALLGTHFGGDGRVNFALPDLRGRVPIHAGGSHVLGDRGGEQGHTLAVAEVPSHTHSLYGSSEGASTNAPTLRVLARGQTSTGSPVNYYDTNPTNLVAMKAGALGNTGGSQKHENMQPFLTVSFCIALQGIFPPSN